MNRMKKILRNFVIVFIILLSIGFWWRYYFVFGEGVKAGNLNFFVKKGMIFKTYEGRLIQDGFKSTIPGSVQSNEFEFSVANEKVAAILDMNSGKMVELRYKEYLGSIPWRGMSKYIVTEVIKAEDRPEANKLPYQ